VIAEPEPSAARGATPPQSWDLIEQAREAQAALLSLRARTAAEGFDD
jgi:hypothetical protein